MGRRQKRRTSFGRVVRDVIESDSMRIPHTNNGGFSKDGRTVLVASCMNEGAGGRAARDPRLGRTLCPICLAPVEVPFGARNYCRRCADVNRAFVDESTERHPKFGAVEDELHAAVVEAAGEWLRGMRE